MIRSAFHLLTLATITVTLLTASDTALPQIVELNAGEEVKLTLPGCQQKTLKLKSVKEFTEPYYEPVAKAFVDAVKRVELTIDVDGVSKAITGGPFHMPVNINGLAILLSNSKGLSGGIRPDALGKDVRLEVASASSKWVTPARLAYPIRDYRWHAMNYQHTYLAVAVNQGKLYYHRGEDMGMIPDREVAVSMIDAEVSKVPGPTGDGASNSVVLKDPAGFILHYAHMNTPNILPSIRPGVKVRSGAPLGLTGNTWQGRPVRDPHLHVEAQDLAKDDTFRHSFPLIVAAYRASFPGEPLPVAGGWRHLYAGKSIELDGSFSLAGDGRTIASYDWFFTDGTRKKGKSVSRHYNKPGTYSEQLTIVDDKGNRGIDFVEVFVHSRQQKKSPPFAWINYYPVRGIHPGTEIEFLTRFSNMNSVTIDFGDGRIVPWEQSTTHRYQKSGVYVATVHGEDSGSGPGVFHVRVIVE